MPARRPTAVRAMGPGVTEPMSRSSDEPVDGAHGSALNMNHCGNTQYHHLQDLVGQLPVVPASSRPRSCGVVPVSVMKLPLEQLAPASRPAFRRSALMNWSMRLSLALSTFS